MKQGLRRTDRTGPPASESTRWSGNQNRSGRNCARFNVVPRRRNGKRPDSVSHSQAGDRARLRSRRAPTALRRGRRNARRPPRSHQAAGSARPCPGSVPSCRTGTRTHQGSPGTGKAEMAEALKRVLPDHAGRVRIELAVAAIMHFGHVPQHRMKLALLRREGGPGPGIGLRIIVEFDRPPHRIGNIGHVAAGLDERVVDSDPIVLRHDVPVARIPRRLSLCDSAAFSGMVRDAR